MALRHLLGACLLIATVLPSAAAGDALTLEKAVARAIADNPELALGRYRDRAADARSREAAQPPPLKLGLELENVGGTGQTRGLSGAETTLLLSRTLERGNKAARRRALAEGRGALVRTEADIRRLDLLARVARRFVHVIRDQHLLAVAEQAVALARRARTQAQRRVEAGAAPASEAARADIALADAELELEHAEHELKATRVSLASLWGERQPGFGRAAGDIYTLPQPDELKTLVAALDQNPQLRRLADRQRIANARRRLANAQRSTDITVSGGIRRREFTDDNAFIVGLSVPLSSDQRAQPGIEAARADAAASRHERDAARRELYAVLYGRYQELKHARTELDTLRQRILPAADTALADIRTGYTRGRYSYLALADAQRGLIEHRRRAIRAAERYHRHLIEIERLTGSPAVAVDEGYAP